MLTRDLFAVANFLVNCIIVNYVQTFCVVLQGFCPVIIAMDAAVIRHYPG